jgi:hypothetical protein
MKIKKFITKTIIYFLIIQLFGCYSPKYISLDEIEKIDSNERIFLVTKDNKEYTLDNSNPGYDGYQDLAEWEIENDAILLITKQLVRDKDKPGQRELIKNRFEIKHEDIAAVSTQEFNLVNTVLFSAGILFLLLIIAWATMGPINVGLTESR